MTCFYWYQDEPLREDIDSFVIVAVILYFINILARPVTIGYEPGTHRFGQHCSYGNSTEV